MTNRRSLLADIAAAALGQKRTDCDCAPSGGPFANYFPNVVVLTHDGRQKLFYNDLVRGKVVMINCFSIRSEEQYPVTENLVQVQRLLGERAGRDVFMYSITAEPERDTPRALSAFAEKHKAGPGWLFLTGPPDAIHSLRARLFANGGGHTHGAPLVKDCSFGLIRYGNEPAGLWASCPVKTEPRWIVERLSWVEARKQPDGHRRRGPFVQTGS